MHGHTHKCMVTHTNAWSHTQMHGHIHTYAWSHTHTHTHTYIYIYALHCTALTHVHKFSCTWDVGSLCSYLEHTLSRQCLLHHHRLCMSLFVNGKSWIQLHRTWGCMLMWWGMLHSLLLFCFLITIPGGEMSFYSRCSESIPYPIIQFPLSQCTFILIPPL